MTLSACDENRRTRALFLELRSPAGNRICHVDRVEEARRKCGALVLPNSTCKANISMSPALVFLTSVITYRWLSIDRIKNRPKCDILENDWFTCKQNIQTILRLLFRERSSLYCDTSRRKCELKEYFSVSLHLLITTRMRITFHDRITLDYVANRNIFYVALTSHHRAKCCCVIAIT